MSRVIAGMNWHELYSFASKQALLELCLFGALLSYGEGEVGAVETAYERLPIEMKLAYDILALVGCY